MKNKDVLILCKQLEDMKISGNRTTKLAYARSKNLQILRLRKEVITDSAQKLSEDDQKIWQEYETARQNLLQQHGRKNPDGTLVIVGGIVALVDPAKFQEDHNIIAEKYEDILKKEAENQKFNTEILDDEAEDINFHMVKLIDLPDDLDQAQMDVIINFIED